MNKWCMAALAGAACWLPTMTPAWAADSIDDIVRKISADVNRNLPATVTPDMRLEKTTPKGAQLLYDYTIVTQTLADIDVEKFKRAYHTDLMKNACTNAKLRQLLELGAVLVYSYNDSEGKFVASLPVTRSNC